MKREKFFAAVVLMLLGVLFVFASAQDKPDLGVGSRRLPATKPSIPLVKVKAQPVMGDFSGFGRRAGMGVASPPAALPPDKRSAMLRESGIDFRPPSAPSEFRLSPRNPYVSSSAYLFSNGDSEFNASGDSLLIRIAQRIPEIRVRFGLGESGWVSAGPQPDPPGFVGVLVRVEPRTRYLADFSVSSSVANTYQMTITGADGSGVFSREAGGQHVLVGLDSTEGGYVRLNLSASSSFTFHNVVVTKLD